MFKRNLELFEELKKLNLPKGEYLICGSGPLGVRMLREMKDLDIKVTNKLWEELSHRYETFYDKCEVIKIKISKNIEAMCERSFEGLNEDAPTFEDQIRDAECFDGLPFENIKTTLFFKKRQCREKDLRDIELIEQWLNNFGEEQ